MDVKIKFSNLKYILVKKSYPRLKRRMSEFFSYQHNQDLIDEYTLHYKKGKIDKKTYNFQMKLLKRPMLQEIFEEGWMSENDKFKSEKGLYDAIIKLVNLDLIEIKPDIKGYDYYMMKDEGIKIVLSGKIEDLIKNEFTKDVQALAQCYGLII